MTSISAKEYQEMINKKPKKLKMGNVIHHTEEGKFDSTGELNRWNELKLIQKSGTITALTKQVRFNLAGVNYIADFVYFDIELKQFIVEDFKGFRTAIYKNKKKLMKNLLGIEIKETSK